jgi:hypothetical protein
MLEGPFLQLQSEDPGPGDNFEIVYNIAKVLVNAVMNL